MSFKNVLTSILAIAAITVAGLQVHTYLNPCGKPLEYSIGEFDTQFGVSQTDFKAKIVKATSIWDKAFNKNFFEYNPNAKFKVNLIYDSRQKEIEQKQKTEFGLSTAESNFKQLDVQFITFKSQYESRGSTHDLMVASFNKEEADYEAQVSYWNSRGGAPKAEYNKLQAQKQNLDNEVSQINNDARELKTMYGQLNALLDQRNTTANNYNNMVAAYNQKFGGGSWCSAKDARQWSVPPGND